MTEGRLDFGTWEQIFYEVFDGRRRMRVLVKIIGEEGSGVVRIFYLTISLSFGGETTL
jgi:hypothetical protein